MLAGNSEALLVSKDSTVLKIMTRVLGEAAFDTVICSHWPRISELAFEHNFALMVFDSPETQPALPRLIHEVNLGPKRRAVLVLLTGPVTHLEVELRSSTDVVVTKPLTIRKARESLKRVHTQDSAEICGKASESCQTEASTGRV
jgi:DNA-binding NtrC family response regulator